jgi:hypothetical protein
LWGHVTVRLLTNLTLNLFTCPAGGIASSAAEVLVCAGLPRHRGKEVVAEVLPEVTVGEGIGKITRGVSRILLTSVLYVPDDTTCRSQKGLRAVAVLLDGAQKIEDGVHEWNKNVG